MTDTSLLERTVGSSPIHRREFRKADGRMLWLYGREPHTLAPLAEFDEEAPRGGEWRFHPLRGEWNVYAAHRQNRTFKPSPADDPLAPTREASRPTEIPFADFEVAIFENRFSALDPDAPSPTPLDGLQSASARGHCEVVVFTPQARGSLASVGQDRREVLLGALIDRYDALFAQGCAYVLPFENRGEEVGVTLHHPHAQIYGFDRIPPVAAREIDAFARGFDLQGEIALSMADYGLGQEGGVAAFVPRFARFPYEVWLAPFERRAHLRDCSDGELCALAHWLGEVTRRYDALFEREAATMMAIHAAPRAGARDYHLTVQFYPLLRAKDRIKYLASVEQHSGVFTIDVMPEAAAKALRDA